MSLFGADQVYTCLEKVYMVYTTLPSNADFIQFLRISSPGGLEPSLMYRVDYSGVSEA
jgi:hypothetical protein